MPERHSIKVYVEFPANQDLTDADGHGTLFTVMDFLKNAMHNCEKFLAEDSGMKVKLMIDNGFDCSPGNVLLNSRGEEVGKTGQLSVKTRSHLVDAIVDMKKVMMFGDGQEEEYIIDGFPENEKPLSKMTDLELVDEWAGLCAGDDDPLLVRARKELNS